MITLVYAYYDNPQMLRLQLETWRSYAPETALHFEAVVTDDASPRWPATIEDVGFPLRLFRIDQDIPWNYLQCRNIGALYARRKWLLITDIDHVLGPAAAEVLVDCLAALDERTIYRFRRRGTDSRPHNPHHDSILIGKDLFWQLGGYDEHYAGLYGYRSRYEHHQPSELLPVALTHYSRTDVDDANTSGLPRREGKKRDEFDAVKTWKTKDRRTQAPGLFLQPYHLVESL